MSENKPVRSSRRWCRCIAASSVALMLVSLVCGRAFAFDQDYSRWDAVLKKYVAVDAGGTRSAVRYGDLKANPVAFRAMLDEFSAVSQAEFDRWPKAQKLAFLINAYNAFTIDLVLGKYPDLKSIKDLGGLFTTPWEIRFIPLLGGIKSLDDIEQRLIRAPGVFDEPRIHVALVCASIGCPMLRPEAYKAAMLDDQLDDATRRFLSDRTRNHYASNEKTLYLSKIFDWYGRDFSRDGERSDRPLLEFLGPYAAALELPPDEIRNGGVSIRYLSYDWRLNDAARMPFR